MKGRGIGEPEVISEGAQKNKSSSGPAAMDKKISCRTENWKYIYNWSGSVELYKLSEDPKETRDLASVEERVSEKFRIKVKEHLEQEKIFRTTTEKALVNQKVKHLKKLKGI